MCYSTQLCRAWSDTACQALKNAVSDMLCHSTELCHAWSDTAFQALRKAVNAVMDHSGARTCCLYPTRSAP